jgi:cysteine desulfurase
MKFPIYLDNNATTPVDPRVLEAMLPYFCEKFGNAASITHAIGLEGESAVSEARKQCAKLIDAKPKEIIFTCGSTESINLAIKGVCEAKFTKRKKVITIPTEHNAVLDSCRYMERHGCEVVYLSVDNYGLIDLDELRDTICDNTALVTIMIGNNEIGTIQPIKEINEICREKDVVFFTDGTQGVGKIPINVKEMGIDMLSFSGHKIYGPKGIGALYINSENENIELEEQMSGGGHEYGKRSGTLNVPGIVGLGKACEICNEEMEEEMERMTKWRDKMINAFLENIDGCILNGHPTQRLPNNVNISIKGLNVGSLMNDLKELAVSSGSACTSAKKKPSHVLMSLGLDEATALSSIRFGLGRFNTEEEVDYAITSVISTINKLREVSAA